VQDAEAMDRRTLDELKKVKNCKNKPLKVKAGVYPPEYPLSR
jgi:hypothetical protein